MKPVLLTILSLTILSYIHSNRNSMGLFDRLFGKKNAFRQEEQKINGDTSKLVKTAEILDEDLYWSIIDKSLKNTGNQDDQEQFLISEISRLTSKQMIGFRLRTDKLLYDTYNSEMWCAGYIMKGGCSDDGFEYFRNWVVSRGKETYYKAKQNPDHLISEVDENAEMYEFESFGYVAPEAFRKQERIYTTT